MSKLIRLQYNLCNLCAEETFRSGEIFCSSGHPFVRLVGKRKGNVAATGLVFAGAAGAIGGHYDVPG